MQLNASCNFSIGLIISYLFPQESSLWDYIPKFLQTTVSIRDQFTRHASTALPRYDPHLWMIDWWSMVYTT